jgi:8-oxo-dGTP diphosphatase
MKLAIVALIIKDGKILCISRRHDKTIFGLIGGKVDQGETLPQALVREAKEEAGITIHHSVPIYKRVELGDGANPVDFESHCYYATDWSGEPKDSEEGKIAWLTAEEVCYTKAAFGDYNRKTLDVFKIMFPNVYLMGE